MYLTYNSRQTRQDRRSEKTIKDKDHPAEMSPTLNSDIVFRISDPTTNICEMDRRKRFQLNPHAKEFVPAVVSSCEGDSAERNASWRIMGVTYYYTPSDINPTKYLNIPHGVTAK